MENRPLSLLICTPCYGGQVTTAYLKSALDLQNELTQAGLKHDWLFRFNESLIQRARNGMAADFLATDYTAMLFIDADIEFTPDDVAKLWNLQDEPGVYVGVYPMKKKGSDWYAAWVEGELVKDLDRFDGSVAVDYAGTGFMCIHRDVFEALKANVGTFEAGVQGQDETRREWDFFPCGIVDGIYESEDYGFCRLCRESGLPVVMDPSIRLKHHGQYAYGS